MKNNSRITYGIGSGRISGIGINLPKPPLSAAAPIINAASVAFPAQTMEMFVKQTIPNKTTKYFMILACLFA